MTHGQVRQGYEHFFSTLRHASWIFARDTEAHGLLHLCLAPQQGGLPACDAKVYMLFICSSPMKKKNILAVVIDSL